jgi:alpha-methylacyl-CoA racemase
MSGPLHGVRLVEIASIGPGPFCGMLFADLGADVIRVDRVSADVSPATPPALNDVVNRGKRSLAVDLKTPDGAEVVLDVVTSADAVIEGFRPGVAERLGIGPAECLGRNPAIVYGRVTGWGQEGPLAHTAGHDIDYIALSGVLHAVGGPEDPVPPLNLVGDFGGGGMLSAFGVLAGVINARATGVGQIVDAAMVDGSALLMTSHHGFVADGWWDGASRAANLLDGAAPFYTTYRTLDGGHVAVGALEPQFYEALIEGLSLEKTELPHQLDREKWPELRGIFSGVFASRTRDDWERHFEGTDACVAPVLSMIEAATHPHNVHRSTFVAPGGVNQPAPTPRFSHTPSAIAGESSRPGADTDAILSELGYSSNRIGMLRDSGSIA